MTLRLRNTLTRLTDAVGAPGGQPGGRASEPVVRMYTCGPTVYRYAHIGNLRTFLLADLIRRALVLHGVRVIHLKNITDVGHMRDERRDEGGDRIVLQAELEGRSTREIADHYEAAFHADEAEVNILAAHRFPRATDHIREMVGLAERLEDAGCAYRTPSGTLYYDVSRFPAYGRLSGNSLDELRAGHRGEVEAEKRDPADFALWKRAEPGRALHWPTSRWGDGFPGWHLECSAMAMRYLGAEFELHTGGVDNVFPHHEDEIAQTAALTGRPPARHWVHGEHLLMSGRKMAKSAGNVRRVSELRDVGIDPLAFRYLVLTSRYRHKLSYTEASIHGADAALRSLRARLARLGPPPAAGPWAGPQPLQARAAGPRPEGASEHVSGHGADDLPAHALTDRAHAPPAPLSAEGRALHERFVAAVDDDLDLPVALGIVREVLRARIPADERRWIVLDADTVLGLDLHRVWDTATAAFEPSDEARTLLEARDVARAAGDYVRADALRERLRALGFEPVDRSDEPGGWRRA